MSQLEQKGNANDFGVFLNTIIDSQYDVGGTRNVITMTPCGVEGKYNIIAEEENSDNCEIYQHILLLKPCEIFRCNNSTSCITLQDILNISKSPLSEEHVWAVIFQSVKLYRHIYQEKGLNKPFSVMVPTEIDSFSISRGGIIHFNNDEKMEKVSSQKEILMKLGIIIYSAMDYNLPGDEECIVSKELENLITYMTVEDTKGEEAENGSELDYVVKLCALRIQSTSPEDYYITICGALVSESIELKIFLRKVGRKEGESSSSKVKVNASNKDMELITFSEWARIWIQVVEEVRQGVHLKKCNFARNMLDYELTPYEVLMDDIRSRKYNLRKVMVNGDVPRQIRKDAHTIIMEFIRSRPSLKKVSNRIVSPPRKRSLTLREQLMDSIRKGYTLRPIQHYAISLHATTIDNSSTSAQNMNSKNNVAKYVENGVTEDQIVPKAAPRGNTPTPKPRSVIPSIKSEDIKISEDTIITSLKSRQRLIKVDFALLQDVDALDSSVGGSNLLINLNESQDSQENAKNTQTNKNTTVMQTQMPSYPVTYKTESNSYNIGAAFSKTSHDLETHYESKRVSMRRHTIVGCQSNFREAQLVISSKPETQKEESNPLDNCIYKNSTANSNLRVMKHWSKNSLDETHLPEKTTDRLSLTLEEIVHIRSVMTKAELESLPVGIRVKEDVEKRKVCFLCLRTRFSIFGPWGIQCKLCQRTVCSKCYSKMRIPKEHFRNIPVILLSPSLINTPIGSNVSSPSTNRHALNFSNGAQMDESFPMSLMERLLRSESDRKIRNSVGSAPSSPRIQRSHLNTPPTDMKHCDKNCPPEINSSTMDNSKSSTKDNSTSVENVTDINLLQHHNFAASMPIPYMSRSMDGPKSFLVHSPARPHSSNSVLDRKIRLTSAVPTLSSPHFAEQKENSLRGELMSVCNDCRGLVLEIIQSSRQTRSSARNRALKNLTLDISPVYKRF